MSSPLLNEALIAELPSLTNMEYQIYQKVITYAINLIINDENQMKIDQFIQIDQAEGERLSAVTLRMIRALVKFKSNVNDMASEIKLIFKDKEKADFLKEKIQANLQELRKVIFQDQLTDLTKFIDMQWRFQVEIASKSFKNDVKPNIILNFQIAQEDSSGKEKIVNNLVNSDFANLKNLNASLLQAMKLHRNAKFKTARNSSV